MLLLAHPLNADRRARNRVSDQGCIRGRIVGAVVAIAAGALDVNATDPLRRNPQHLGDGLAIRIYTLRVGPDGDAVLVGLSDGTGRTD